MAEKNPNSRNAQQLLKNLKPSTRLTNIHSTERTISTISGIALAVYGLSRGNVRAAVMGLLGGGLMIYRGVSGHDPIYETLGMRTIARQNGSEMASISVGTRSIHIEKSITVNRSADDLFAFWRNFENLPRFMNHLESVRVIDPMRSHWKAKAPAGMTVEWDAEIINEEPGRVIGWRSLENAQVPNAGSVRFTPATDGRGTQIRVSMEYTPPGGVIGVAIARIFGEEPEMQVVDDLNRFKQILETGAVATTKGQASSGHRPATATLLGRIQSPDSLVQNAGEESFPASDPPAWTGTREENSPLEIDPKNRTNL